MLEANDRSLSLSVEPHFELFVPPFLRDMPKRKKQSRIHSCKVISTHIERSIYKHKTWPNHLFLKYKTETRSPSPENKKTEEPEKKLTFFSQNSFNFASFIAKTNKNSELQQKTPNRENNNGFDISFNQSPEENKENFNEQGVLASNISAINNDQSPLEREPPSERQNWNQNRMELLNNLRTNLNEPQNHILASGQGGETGENDENQRANSVDFEKVYRQSLKLFIYKTMKNHFFAHLFMFFVILKFLFDLDSGIVLLNFWIADAFNFIYYGYKIYLSKQYYK